MFTLWEGTVKLPGNILPETSLTKFAGLAFKSKKDKLYWMSMISEPKGKKSSALTRSDLNRLELINTHLANFIDAE